MGSNSERHEPQILPAQEAERSTPSAVTPRWSGYLPRIVRERLAGRTYLHRVIGNTAWVLTERIVRYSIGFLVGIWIARAIGPAQYGSLNYSLAFVQVFAFLTTLGLDSLVVRDMLRNPDTRNTTLGTLLLMRLLGGAVMTLLTGTAIVALRADRSSSELILVISLAQWLLAFDSIDCLFQADVTSRRTVVARLVALLTVTAGRILLILFHASTVAFAWAIAAESALIAICMLIAYARSGRSLAALKPSLACAATLIAQGWPLMLTAAVVAIAQRIDQVMLGMMTDYLQVGAYAIAVRAVEVMYVVPTVVGISVFPAIIKSKSLDEAAYRRKIQHLYTVMWWTGVALALPLSLLAGEIVALLVGKSYSAAAPVLAILAWMPAFMFFSIVRQRWLFAESALATALALESCACAINVIANLLLIPLYGARGAAVAALAGAVGATMVLAPFSRPIRQSLVMLLRAAIMPLRLARQA